MICFEFFRRKLLTTAQYIYKTLFQEEKGSDITVLMLGKAWRLHKVYISQVKSLPQYVITCVYNWLFI